jgi:DNA-binding response OmpR family regulator
MRMWIALLEDENHHAQHVCTMLETVGYRVSIYANGDDLIAAIDRHTFDFFVLDWHVPGTDGMGVLKYLRETKRMQEPVVFLTSRLDEHYATTALNAGADDYCTKPLRPGEFLARIGAVARRLKRQQPSPHDTEHEILGYRFDPTNCLVAYGEVTRTLTQKEFKLARFMFDHAERPVSRERLISEVWGTPSNDEITRTLDVHMSWVRKKLNLGSQAEQLRIKPIYGYGYRLVTVTREEYVQ